MRRTPILTLLALTGCASVGPQLTVAAAPDPASLVGWWQVEGTEQVVLIDPAGLEILDPVLTTAGGYVLSGSWRGDPEGRLLVTADILWFPATPGEEDEPWEGLPKVVADYSPGWVTTVAGFRIAGDQPVLLDRSGAQVARLVPRAPVTGSERVDPGRPLTEQERRNFGPAAPVPDGLRPAEPAELVGRWAPEGVAATAAFVAFADTGAWTGSDGCNGDSGRWLTGSAAAFLSTRQSLHTDIGCENIDVGSWVAAARRVALDGQVLVLLDVEGRTVGRLVRAPDGPVPD
jgi:hypothetical protein